MALTEYANRHGGELPADISEVAATFPSPMREAVPQRYKLLRSGNMKDLKPKEPVVQEIPPVPDGRFADQQEFGYLVIGLSHSYDWFTPDGKEKVFAK